MVGLGPLVIYFGGISTMGWGKKLGICIMVAFFIVLGSPEVGEKVGVDCWMELEYLQIILNMTKNDEKNRKEKP